MSAIPTTQQPKNKSIDENTYHSKKLLSSLVLRNSLSLLSSFSLPLSLAFALSRTHNQVAQWAVSSCYTPSLWQLGTASILNSWWVWAGRNGGSHTFVHTSSDAFSLSLTRLHIYGESQKGKRHTLQDGLLLWPNGVLEFFTNEWVQTFPQGCIIIPYNPHVCKCSAVVLLCFSIFAHVLLGQRVTNQVRTLCLAPTSLCIVVAPVLH